MERDGGTKRFNQLSLFTCAFILLKTMLVYQKSDSVSRKQNASSKNQYNMSNRIPSSKIPAQVNDAQFSLVWIAAPWVCITTTALWKGWRGMLSYFNRNLAKLGAGKNCCGWGIASQILKGVRAAARASLPANQPLDWRVGCCIIPTFLHDSTQRMTEHFFFCMKHL